MELQFWGSGLQLAPCKQQYSQQMVLVPTAAPGSFPKRHTSFLQLGMRFLYFVVVVVVVRELLQTAQFLP